jgi:hypothetical protein
MTGRPNKGTVFFIDAIFKDGHLQKYRIVNVDYPTRDKWLDAK